MIQIINTGVANIRSLQAAFDRLEVEWNLTVDRQQIESASHVVLPGVGAFSAAVHSLDELGLRESIRKRLCDPTRATLSICLGMQLLGQSSEESPDAIGLGVIDCRIKRFPATVPVPQLGWNQVVPARADDGSREVPFGMGEAYFANSFRLVDPPPNDWGFAVSDYGGPFVSSIWRGRTLACQFHPELSGDWGQQLLANWIGGQRVLWQQPESSAC